MDGGQDRVLGVLPNGPLHCMCETLHLTQPLGKKTGMCACGEGDSVKGQICWQLDIFALRKENIDKMLKATTVIKRYLENSSKLVCAIFGVKCTLTHLPLDGGVRKL